MTVAVVCGMGPEAYVARQVFKTAQVVQYQHTPGFDLGSVLDPKTDTVWSFGVAGGNKPGFRFGSLGIASSLVDDTGTSYPLNGALFAAIRDTAAAANLHFAACPWFSCSTMNVGTNPASRAAILQKYGAWADDDESYWIAKFCAAHGIPMGIVRTLSDDWLTDCPKLIDGALTPQGKVDMGYILANLSADQVWPMAKAAWMYEDSLNTLLYSANALRAAMEFL